MTLKPSSAVKPQTRIFSHGYDPQRSEGAAVPPVFRTSTFIFKTAAEGKRAFELAYGLDSAKLGESPALIYTRVNNPNSDFSDANLRWTISATNSFGQVITRAILLTDTMGPAGRSGAKLKLIPSAPV